MYARLAGMAGDHQSEVDSRGAQYIRFRSLTSPPLFIGRYVFNSSCTASLFASSAGGWFANPGVEQIAAYGGKRGL